MVMDTIGMRVQTGTSHRVKMLNLVETVKYLKVQCC